MYLGSRKIRSAGRTSGSIEITLPPVLQALQGVECHLIVRDGPRPEIVLQTDLSEAHALFRELWQKLCLGLGEIGELGDLPLAGFSLALFTPHHWQERPPLAYADALAVLRHRAGQANHCRASEALVRLLAFLAVAAAYRLGLKNALALAFGDAVAYITTGTPAGLGADFERGMAHRLFWNDDREPQPIGSPFDDQVWREARSGFRRVYDQFYTWQNSAQDYTATRDRWYRALMVEMANTQHPVANIA